MSDLFNLLPRDKHDFERVNDLKNIDKQDLIKHIPELLEWLQDINWPIAVEICKLLLTVPEETIPFVIIVLAGEDDIWKEWCLRCFVKELPTELIENLKEELERIAYRPTKGEELEEVHVTAREILKR
ncbi:tartrate dehydratase subunit alpha [Bacillus sp. FJAT-18019]|nr:tartrate dehydratase subunit alpha [Bacillus sp. FJAT-18019]